MAVNGLVGADYLLTRLGNSYDKEDCIHAVVINLIRNCAGGNKSYRTAGCTELWNSINSSGKYRHITKRMTLAEATAEGLMIGDLPVIYNSNTGVCEHIAYYMGGIGGYECIHSSKSKGCVCGTTLKNGFTHVLRHRDITGIHVGIENEQITPGYEPDEIVTEDNDMNILYYARVHTEGGALNFRSSAKKSNNIVCEIPYGTELAVLENGSEWTKIQYDGMVGYVASQYLAYSRAPETDHDPIEDENDGEITDQVTGLFHGTWGVFIPCSSKSAANTLAKHFADCHVIKVELGD